MDSACISSLSHHTIESIDLANKVAFPQTTDCRIAAHRTDFIQIEAYQTCPCAKAGACTSCLDPGMASADNYDIEVMHRGGD